MTVQKTDWNPELAHEWAEGHGVDIDQRLNMCEQAFTVFDESGDPLASATVARVTEVCFFENLITRPNLTASRARRAAIALKEAAGSWAKDRGCNQLVSLVQSKGMARELEKAGFEQQGSPMAFMRKEI